MKCDDTYFSKLPCILHVRNVFTVFIVFTRFIFLLSIGQLLSKGRGPFILP